MKPTRVLPIVSVLSLVTVEYGGYALLGFLNKGDGLNDWQRTFFRAGHAHAGVLLVLSLVYFLYLERTKLSPRNQWLAGGLLLSGVLAQSGGFFLHMGVGKEGQRSPGTTVTESGALLIAAALIALGVGLIKNR